MSVWVCVWVREWSKRDTVTLHYAQLNTPAAGGKHKGRKRRDETIRVLGKYGECFSRHIRALTTLLKLKWAPPWQANGRHDSERIAVTESGKKERRESEWGGNKTNEFLSGRGTRTCWCFIVSWPLKTTMTINDQRSSINDLFIYLWFLLINYCDIQIQVCVEIFARELYLYLLRLLALAFAF